MAKKATPKKAHLLVTDEQFEKNHLIGNRASLFAKDYALSGLLSAARGWATRQRPKGLEASEDALRVSTDAMARAIATSGVTQTLLSGSGYLTGWINWLKSRWKSQIRIRNRITAKEGRGLDKLLPPGCYYVERSPDKKIIERVEVIPTIHREFFVTIDGVRWSSRELQRKMRAIEDCPSDWGGESMHGSGEDTMMMALLKKHAGLKSSGGYHNSPSYESSKWGKFKELLESLSYEY
jgi:hypothetical protein